MLRNVALHASAIAAPGTVAGYEDGPALTGRPFADKWFQSGNIGTVSLDGMLSITGGENECRALAIAVRNDSGRQRWSKLGEWLVSEDIARARSWDEPTR